MSKYVGQSYKRKEDYRLVSGTGKFVADLRAPNMLEACFIRSTHAHARILDIDVTEAAKVDGVFAIITSREIEGKIGQLHPLQKSLMPQSLINKVDHTVHSCPEDILAKDRVVYVGQPVAVILAENRYIAEDAEMLINVEYDPLPVLTDPFEAAKEDAFIIHPHMDGNVQAEVHLSTGDVHEAFKNADHVLSARVKTPRVAHNPMETRGVFATYDTRLDQLVMWSSTQVPYMVRTCLAELLQLVEDNIRVIAPDVGGGFGLKGPVYTEEILLGYLTKKYKRPVRWIEDRLENLSGSRHGRDQIHDVEVAFMQDGTIVGLKDEFILDSGAYNTPLLVIPYNTAAHLRGIFKIKNYDVKGRAIITNKAPVVPYRGAGRPEAVFTMDRIIYKVAEHLGMDPVRVMMENMIQPEEMPYDTGVYYRDGAKAVYDSGDYPGGLKQALEMVDYDNFREKQKSWHKAGKHIGIGISSYVEGTGVGPYEGAHIRLDTSGQVVVNVGSSPHGQSHETTFSQICADELDISPEQVTVKAGDTSLLPYGVGSYASRSAVVAGSAVQIASQKLKEKLLVIASHMLGVNSKDIVISGGKIYQRTSPEKCITFREIALASKPGLRSKVPEGMEPGVEVTHYFVPETVTYSFGFHVAVVEVDKETGFIEILRYVAVDDCGKVINPMVVAGQVQGGVAQGIGGALYEKVMYDQSGQMITGTYMDYLIPTSMEIPDIEMGHQEALSTRNKSGFKGAGEAGAISPLGAIANAVNDALSPLKISIDEVPISPNCVWKSIREVEKVDIN